MMGQQTYSQRIAALLLSDEEGREFIRRMLFPKEIFQVQAQRLRELKNKEKTDTPESGRLDVSWTEALDSLNLDRLPKSRN